LGHTAAQPAPKPARIAAQTQLHIIARLGAVLGFVALINHITFGPSMALPPFASAAFA
jgi:hypothetical protein